MPLEHWDKLPGRLMVVSGPSGCGKSTLVRRVVSRADVRARLSTSATTRPARPGEVEGRDYFFLTRPAFEAAIKRGEFLEWAQVYGNLYGTPAAPVRAALADGWCVVLEIDVQGAMLVRQRVPSALLVFIDVPSIEVLEARLRARATDDDLTIQRRLANARLELEQASFYDLRLVNDDLQQAEEELAAIVNQQGCQSPSAS